MNSTNSFHFFFFFWKKAIPISHDGISTDEVITLPVIYWSWQLTQEEEDCRSTGHIVIEAPQFLIRKLENDFPLKVFLIIWLVHLFLWASRNCSKKNAQTTELGIKTAWILLYGL